MSGFDTIGMCARNLVKRKLRTFLTLLGVLIGTASIILMISFGLATDAMFDQMIEDMGFDMTRIDVHPVWQGSMMWCEETNQPIPMEPREITDQSVAAISGIEGVLFATPLLQESLILRSGPYVIRERITGILPSALRQMGLGLTYGRLLNDDDGFAVVFGSAAERHFVDYVAGENWSNRLWEEMWSEVETLVDIYNDPIRLYYDPNSHPFRWGWWGDDGGGVEIEEAMRTFRSFDIEVVGVLEPTGDQWDPWPNGVIYMDIALVEQLVAMRDAAQITAREEDEWNPWFSAAPVGPRTTFDNLFVRAGSIDYVRDVADTIRDMGYQAHFQGAWIDSHRQGHQAVQTLLAVIAAISLFVAAINIANTMITSVTERTREIGIMKVIGASLMDIRKLFLTEAVVIGMLGGLLGIGLAFLGSYALNNFDIEFLNRLNMAPPITTEGMEDAAVSLITPWLVGVALAVASGVGLVSGIFPAWHATRLSALAAIRNE